MSTDSDTAVCASKPCCFSRFVSPLFFIVNVSLQAYRKVKGRDLSVPSSFVVPSFLPWPQSCWGLRLGTALVDIRSKGR